MKSSVFAIVTAVLALTSGAAPAGKGGTGQPVVLVVPSRYAFVKVAQDLATLRPITVVSYSPTNSASLFLWNNNSTKWSTLDSATFSSGTGFDASSHVIVLGTDVATVHMFATSAKSWSAKTTSFPKYELVKVLNAVSDSLHFSKAEWEWLANRYEITLKDDNEQRRRYGKYGDPREHKKTPPPKTAPAAAVDVVLPEPVPESAPVAPAPAATETPKQEPAK
jgi:hypothetical protein